MAVSAQKPGNDRPVAATLKREREHLIEHFLEEDSIDFLDRHSRVLDDYFQESFQQSRVGPSLDLIRNPYVMIALGGYGRGEQCVYSDVDLLFLFEKKVPGHADRLIREVIYPLWDIGLDVGYATRSIKECLSLARSDYEVLTSLLDARFICGMSNLYTRLSEEIRSRILVRKSGDVIRWLIDTNQERHRRFGDSTYRLEPNLKEGKGGLRDYHTMLWVGHIKSGIKQPRDLEYYGYLSHDEYRSLRSALHFVWSVRNRLHHLTGRKCDQLYFEHQVRMADAMDFAEGNGQQPVEVFLSKLHAQMDYIKNQFLMFLYEQGYANKRRRRRPKSVTTDTPGLRVVQDRLHFASPEAILEDPPLLLRIFWESAQLKVPLSSEAKRLVKEFGHLVDASFSASPEVIRVFERILTTPVPAFNVLKEMLSTGFLERFIPEFGNIVHRIQYDEYHLYPVDKHSLRVVQTLKTFGTEADETGSSLCGELYRSTPGRKLLLWAALLHDIGKGNPGKNHSKTGARTARRILKAKGFKSAEVDTVGFLVEHHLLLVKTATRRDVNDEETAIVCARQIKDLRLLKQLYLLTVADSMATGPKAWTEWTAALLRDLFFKILNILERGELASGEVVEMTEEKRTRVLETARSEEERAVLADLFSVMSPRYLMAASVEEMQEHIDLFRRIGDADFVWDITTMDDSDTRRVTVCAKDRPGLFSQISGVFTLNSLDILGAEVFTWRNNIALDIFQVKAPPDQIFESERWDRAAGHLKKALAGELDLGDELKDKISALRSRKTKPLDRPNRVVIDNESSSFFTLIEVFTYDFPGLLFSLTDTLLQCRLDIWVAKIATFVDQVVDVFYVRDFDGQKVDTQEQVDTIRERLSDVLAGTHTSIRR